MTPIYEYECPGGCGSKELIRKWKNRDEPLPTCDCGEPMRRIVSAHHAVPDGMYSYAPNLGSAEAFERKQERIKRKKETGSYD